MLSIENVTIRYEARTVLREVNLSVNAGEVLALIGPNGVGKSTLIRACSGSLKPIGGCVTIDGQDVHGLRVADRAKLMAVVPQAVRLPESFSVFETVLMGRTPYLGWLGREGEPDRSAVQSALERTCTLELAERPIGELSGGEQQRVLIARALAQSARTLLLDEPTAHLDLKHQAGVLSLVCDLAHAEQQAVLLALHDLNLAAQYADRVALLSNGTIAALGTPAEVLTEENLSPAYGLRITVYEHPAHGAPLVHAEN
ncbi:Petrobactin import ATP-binding protein FpuD [Thermoflexales bacterium]|nr:Petrobactin import ATP-binding protein FpuD [Thermoflexales bacterium]